SVEVLRELLRRDVDRAAIGTIWDPGAVALCHNAGEATEIALRLGGKVDRFHGAPIDVEGTIERLGGGGVEYKGPEGRGARAHMGRGAVLRIPTRHGRVRVILNEHRIQTLDPEVFRSVGIEPAEERVLLVKSVVHFRAAFEPIASRIIEVEG